MAINRVGIFMAAALALGTVSQASAHVPSDPTNPFAQELYEHMDWVMKATNKQNGNCCHNQDVMVGDGISVLPEEIDENGNYIVTIKAGTKIFTNTSDDSQFYIMEKDYVLKIPPANVLDPETANRVCKTNPSPTCTPPQNLNVLFVNPNYLKTGNPTVYCYLPRPNYS